MVQQTTEAGNRPNSPQQAIDKFQRTTAAAVEGLADDPKSTQTFGAVRRLFKYFIPHRSRKPQLP